MDALKKLEYLIASDDWKVEKVYVGKEGCRCGCNGVYYYPSPDDLDFTVYDVMYQGVELARDGAKTDVGYIGEDSCWVNITCSPERVYTIYFNKK